VEYALEGHGYSVARVVRGVLHAEGLTGPELHFVDSIMQRIEATPRDEDADLKMLGRMVREVRHAARSRLAAGRGAAKDAPSPAAASPGGDELTLEAPPGLLSTLRPLSSNGPLEGFALRTAAAAKGVFDKLGPEMGLQVTQCTLEKNEAGDEDMLIGVHWPARSADVRPNDRVSGGVLIALRRDHLGAYRLQALPRLYRKVCQNGMVMPLRDVSIHEIDPRPLFASPDNFPLAVALEKATRACLDHTMFEWAAERCRRSAGEDTGPSATPLASLLESRLRPQVLWAVHRRYAMARDFTRWGMVNAVTAEARTAPSALMLRLERVGGELAAAADATPAPRRASSPSIAAVMASMEDLVLRTGSPARGPKKTPGE
jgi:hypothetical protein